MASTTGIPTAAAPAVAAAAGPAALLAGVVAAGCLYEVGAEAVNRAVGVDVLPSCTALLERSPLRAIARGRPPRWLRTGTALGVGLVAGAIGKRRR